MTSARTVWERRWISIHNTLEILLKRYEEFLQEGESRRENTIFELLLQVQRFGSGQFYFFHDGFYTKQFVDLLPIPDAQEFPNPSYITGYPIEEHILANTLAQITEDLVVVQRASEQRLIAMQRAEQGHEERESIISTLVQVDKLAHSALRMLHVYLESPNEVALTYFRKSANVRVIPYAPVALIGIPTTAVGLDGQIGVVEDLLAIPHEVAHHVYWNGKADSGASLQAELAARTQYSPVAHWTEEIFADVVGCLVGGPVVARSFIDLMVTNIGTAFDHSHDPHPSPAIRPFLYARTLDAMGMSTIADEVRGVWRDVLDARSTFPNRAHLYAAYEVVDSVLAIIDHEDLAHWLRWSEEAAYDELYSNLDSRFAELADQVSEEELDPQSSGELPSWQEIAARLLQNDDLDTLPEDWAVQLSSAEPSSAGQSSGSALQISAYDWLKIFDFDGWIAAGPGGANLHGGP